MILRAAKSQSPSQSAFTLIEVLFATLAFSIVLAAINTVFYGALRMRERADETHRRIRPQFQALEIIKKDLRATFYSEDFRADRFWCEPVGGLSAAGDQLQFFSSTGVTSENSPWPDVQKIEYYLAPSMDPRKSPNTMDLVRAVTRNFLTTIVEQPIEQRLASGISGFQLSFFDGEIWQETWDSEIQDPVLPKAVQVYLEFAPTNYVNRANQFPPSLTQMVSILAEPRLSADAEEDGTDGTEDESRDDEGDGQGGDNGGNQGGGQGGNTGGAGGAPADGGRG